MKTKAAHVVDGKVVNLVLVDDEARAAKGLPPWTPPEGELIPVQKKDVVDIGYLYDGQSFTPPAPVPVEPTLEEKFAELEERVALLESAKVK